MRTLHVCYEHYKGGTNNLKVAFDDNGVAGTSLIDVEHAKRNYKRALNRWQMNANTAKKTGGNIL